MAEEKNSSNQSSKANPPFDAIRVMVVDDDIICLSTVAGMLKTWKYQVVTIKSAEDALATLRSRTDFFHLVVTDVHMPVMDGFEFQKQVREEFDLPVVMMSADEKESSILRGLEGGASFYIVKPVSYGDLKDLWQYAVNPRTGESAAIREIVIAQAATSSVRPLLQTGAFSVAVMQEEKQKKREPKKNAEMKVTKENQSENNDVVVPRKSKVIWTTALHNEFLEAIRKIGLERAVPKMILEHMNEPGLTRENVASHLQKYRIFLKRITEATSLDGSSHGKNLIERTLRSSFATGHPSLMINALQQGLLGNIRLPPSFGATVFSNQQALSSNHVLQLGHGKSHLGGNSAYFQLPTFGDNSLYQANDGDVSGTNKKLYEQETQVGSELVPGVMSECNYSTRNIGSGSSFDQTSNSTCSYNIGSQVEFPDSDLIHGNTGNMNFGCYSQGRYCHARLGRTSDLSPRFSTVNLQENNQNLMSQENNLGKGGLFDHLTTNTVSGENVFPPQISGSNACDIFLNQQKNPSYIELESIRGLWSYNTNKLDDYRPSFDPYPNEQQGGGGLLDPSSYGRYPKVNPSWNQGIGDDTTNSVFGPGKY